MIERGLRQQQQNGSYASDAGSANARGFSNRANDSNRNVSSPLPSVCGRIIPIWTRPSSAWAFPNLDCPTGSRIGVRLTSTATRNVPGVTGMPRAMSSSVSTAQTCCCRRHTPAPWSNSCPRDRWSNLMQDILLLEPDARTHSLRCRFFPEETKCATVAEAVETMLSVPRWVSRYSRRDRQLNLETKSMILVGDCVPGGRNATIRGVDGLCLANLEGSLLSAIRGVAPAAKAGPVLSNLSLPQTSASLLFSLANNHIMDFGADGLESTIDSLAERGYRWVGAGADETQARQSVVVTDRDVRVGVISCCEAQFGSGDPLTSGDCSYWPVAL